MGFKPNLYHSFIWECPIQVLKEKTRKFEPRSEVCVFFGYCNEIKEGLFYNS